MILSNRNIKQTKTSQICFNRKDYTHLHKQWHHKHGEYSNRGSNNEFSWFTDYLLANKWLVAYTRCADWGMVKQTWKGL
jgi:hypothetical protein